MTLIHIPGTEYITRTEQDLADMSYTGKLEGRAFIWVPENDIPVYTSAPEMLNALTDILKRIENIQPKYRDKHEDEIINQVKAIIHKATLPNRLTEEALIAETGSCTGS
jgi:hypothetical protein